MSMFPPDTALSGRISPSPNHDERRDGIAADIILLHYTGMASSAAAEQRLCDPEAKVSSHYLVYEDGSICQMVPEARRAWHAGISSWHGDNDINSRSIGIEIANPGHDYDYPDFPRVQIDAVIALCRDIIKRRSIKPEMLLAHSDVAPSRKNDPGEKFPWDRLGAQGIGLWIEPTKIVPGPELDPGDHSDMVSTLQRSLKKFGYGIEATGNYDDKTKDVVTAFQRHFRPARVDGLADHSTFDTLKRLLALLKL
jgi:N-acetylmuramoyl-L-alanine amidase